MIVVPEMLVLKDDNTTAYFPFLLAVQVALSDLPLFPLVAPLVLVYINDQRPVGSMQLPEIDAAPVVVQV